MHARAQAIPQPNLYKSLHLLLLVVCVCVYVCMCVCVCVCVINAWLVCVCDKCMAGVCASKCQTICVLLGFLGYLLLLHW